MEEVAFLVVAWWLMNDQATYLDIRAVIEDRSSSCVC
jgi:hypothetical protein